MCRGTQYLLSTVPGPAGRKANWVLRLRRADHLNKASRCDELVCIGRDQPCVLSVYLDFCVVGHWVAWTEHSGTAAGCDVRWGWNLLADCPGLSWGDRQKDRQKADTDD